MSTSTWAQAANSIFVVTLGGCSGAALKAEVGVHPRGGSGAVLRPEANSVFVATLGGCSGAAPKPGVEVQPRGGLGAAAYSINQSFLTSS